MDNQKTIFVTGAASGIGRATALLFAEKGWYVGLFDIDRKNLDELARHIGDDNCCFRVTDVVDSKEVEASVHFFEKRTNGQMDILFNNAGIYRVGPFEEMNLDDKANIVNINVLGVINCIHFAFDILKRTKGAQIINMCSSSALYGVPEIAVYSATKFAVRGLTEALNIEFERHDIMVSDIMVSFVQTPLLNQKKTSMAQEKSGVHLTAEEVAGLIWKAAYGKKIHWGLKIALNRFLIKLLPASVVRSIMKAGAWYNS